MSVGPTTEASKARRAAVVVGATALIVSSAGVAYAATGQLATEDPPYPDYLWQPWPPLDEHAVLIGVLSLAVFACAVVGIAWALRQRRVRPTLVAQVAVLAAFAAWLGGGYRIVTDGVTGANIGGGLVLLATPIVAFMAVALVVIIGVAAHSSSNQARDATPAPHC